MGKLTTHILDTANGKPASNVAIRLFAGDAERTLLVTTATNSDGPVDHPRSRECVRLGQTTLLLVRRAAVRHPGLRVRCFLRPSLVTLRL